MAKMNSAVSKLMNAQIAMEFEAMQHYLAMAVYLEGRSLEYAAGFFFAQADEEREHAMKFLRFMLEVGETPVVPALSEPRAGYDSLGDVVRAALENEQRVTASIHKIVGAASSAGDHRAFQFLQWFVAEQIEEEATMEKLIAVVEMAHNELQAEQYMRNMEQAH